MRLDDGIVDGRHWLDFATRDGDWAELAVPLSAIAWDALRQRHNGALDRDLAAPELRTRLAILDLATGTVAYSDPLPGQPVSLSASADGKWLYVSTFGEVLRLALPGLTLQARAGLEPEPATGRTPGVGGVRASPVDPSVVVVSTAAPDAGLRRLRDMVEHTGRSPLAAAVFQFDFTPGGGALVGWDLRDEPGAAPPASGSFGRRLAPAD